MSAADPPGPQADEKRASPRNASALSVFAKSEPLRPVSDSEIDISVQAGDSSHTPDAVRARRSVLNQPAKTDAELIESSGSAPIQIVPPSDSVPTAPQPVALSDSPLAPSGSLGAVSLPDARPSISLHADGSRRTLNDTGTPPAQFRIPSHLSHAAQPAHVEPVEREVDRSVSTATDDWELSTVTSVHDDEDRVHSARDRYRPSGYAASSSSVAVPTVTFETMPEEWMLGALAYLSAHELARLSAVSKRFNKLCSHHRLWEELLTRDFDSDAKGHVLINIRDPDRADLVFDIRANAALEIAAGSSASGSPRELDSGGGPAAVRAHSGGSIGSQGLNPAPSSPRREDGVWAPTASLHAVYAAYTKRGKELKDQYASLYAKQRAREQQRIESQRRFEQAQFRQRWRDRTRDAYEFCHLRIMTAIGPILGLLFTIFICLHLQDPDSWSIGSAFSPLFVACGLALLGMLSVCIPRLPSLRDHWLCADLTRVNLGCIPVSVHSMANPTAGSVVAALLVISLLCFIASLTGRLTGAVTSSWAVVFIPLWFFFALLCVGPPLWLHSGDRLPVITALWVIGLGPLLVFCALLVAHLDLGVMSLHHVLVPFWIVDGLFMAGTLAACSFAVCYRLKRLCVRRWLECVKCSERDTRGSLAWFCVVWLVLVPIVMFQVLVTLQVEHVEEYKWATVFIPILLWESFVVVFAIGLAVAIS